jgi:hypothetical protein
MNLPSRKESLIMMGVTGVYLLFEVAFGARLLDVVGSTTDIHEIEQIENAGRVISGIALTLVVWTSLILPRIRRMTRWTPWRRTRSVFMLGGSTILCCLASYLIQEAILDGLSYGSNPAQRQAASTLTLVSSSVQNSSALLRGLDFDLIDRSSPESKTFMALLPSLALSVDRLEERTKGSIEDLLAAQAEKIIGGPNSFYLDVYLPTNAQTITLFNEVYLPAAEPHAKAIDEIPDEQTRLYQKYRNDLGRFTPTSLPRSQYSRLRSQLRQAGIMVPLDWVPTDRAGFMSAVDSMIRGRVTPEYERVIRDAFGSVLPDDLTPAQFFSHPAVQQGWRSRIGMTQEIPLAVNLEQDAAERAIYRPWIEAIVDERRPLYFSPISAFEEGSEHYEDGVTAIRIAYIPLIAFTFSILGALVHSFKTLNFGLKAAVPIRSVRAYRIMGWAKTALFGLIISIGALAARNENPVTRSELFLELEAQTSERIGAPLPVMMRAVIQLQTYNYPIAETLRNRVLFGITYDFDPETETPAFEYLDLGPLISSLLLAGIRL